MAMGREKVVIDGLDGVYFSVRKFEPFLGVKILADLQRLFSSTMISMDMSDGASPEAMIAKALGELSNTMNGSTVQSVLKTLLDPEYVSVTTETQDTVKLTEGQVNMVFDDVSQLMDLAVKVAIINYKPVFTKWFTLIGEALSKRGVNPSESSMMKLFKSSSSGDPSLPIRSRSAKSKGAT